MRKLFTAGVRSARGVVTRVRTRAGKTGLTETQLAAAKASAASRDAHVVDVHAVAERQTKAQLAIATARRFLGVHESPAGSNRGPQVDAWLRDAGCPVGNPWCAAFACAMWVAAGLVVPGGSNAGCYHLRTAAERAGRWSKTPVLGAIGIFHGDEHAVLVTGPMAGGRVPTIAGNTSQGDGRNPNGGTVAAHDLPLSLFSGFILP